MQTEQLNINLPTESSSLTKSMNNLFIALNKANKAGLFELTESSQIANDFNLISGVIGQIIKIINLQKEARDSKE